MDKNALIVIDVQNYFFSPESGAYIRNSERVLRNINKVIEYFSVKERLIIFTKFISPKSKTANMRKKWKHMPSLKEREFAEKLILSENYILINKESYSSFEKTKLLRVLRKNKIERIFFTGVMTHLCVESTVRDSFEKGFSSTIIKDCCKSSSPEFHRSAIKIMKHGFSDIVTVKDIINEKI